MTKSGSFPLHNIYEIGCRNSSDRVSDFNDAPVEEIIILLLAGSNRRRRELGKIRSSLSYDS